MCLALLTLVLTIIVLLYVHVTRHFDYWKNINVPYLKPTPFFGNIFTVCTLKISMSTFMNNLYKATTNPFTGFFAFDQPFLFVRDPRLIKSILIKDFDYFHERSVMENRKDDEIGSNMLFVLKNPAWKSIRAKIAGIFASGRMKNMTPLVNEACEDMINYLDEHFSVEKSIESREVCMKLTTDVISSCAFGIQSRCFKDERAEFREVSRRIFDFNLERKIHMAAYFLAPFLVKMFKMKFLEPLAAKFMNDVFLATMVERELSKATRGDVIDILIQIKQNNKQANNPLDEKLVVAQAIQFFVAGFETTGSTISFALYELALNQSIQDRLRIEINDVLRKYDRISFDAIQEMKYLDMTVSETLRKYPLLPFLDRRCTHPYTIPGTDVVIKKGLPIYISLLGLHYDQVYFPDPDIFDPERFTSENKGARPSCVYMPFGDGPRNCIGARFGLMVSKVALIRILTNFTLDVTEDTPIPLEYSQAGFLLSPINGIQLSFKKICV